MSEALKPMTAPVVEEHNIVENGPMTVEMRTENCGLFQLGGGIGRFNQTGATEPWRLPYEEVLYTLSGRLRLRFGDEVLEAGPGEVGDHPEGCRGRLRGRGRHVGVLRHHPLGLG